MAGKNRQVLRALEQELRFLEEIGAEFLFAPEGRSRALPERRGAAGEPAEAKTAPADVARKPEKERRRSLLALEAKILECTLCPLSQSRTLAVPGEGDYSAALMFVGEGPGADEDIQGRPFVGRAGQLLTRIVAAMHYKRQDVYITNVVKCRPPHNRTPFRIEVESCRPYLLEQIENIAPRVIVALGKAATDFFHPSAAGMTSLRGNFIEYGNILVMPTFHPSYLIRNEGNRELKKLVWQDMQKVMAVLSRK